MSTTFRRIETFVQKLAKMASLSTEESHLAEDVVVGISKTGSCKVSDVARAKKTTGTLREIARPGFSTEDLTPRISTTFSVRSTSDGS